MTKKPNGKKRTATTYKMSDEQGEWIRDFCRRQQKRHGHRGPLTGIQKVIDAALEAYMPTLRKIDRDGGGQDGQEG
jgi:hypothetical protein